MATEDRDVICKGKYFAIVAEPTHGEFVRCGDEVLIVAITDGDKVILTVEPSAAFPGLTVVLPGGSTDPGLPHEETANHELQEEAGYAAARLDFLGELRPFSKYLTVRSFVYLARGLRPSRLQGDETYGIGVEQVPFDEFESLITAGRLLDARVIAALYRARAFIDREKAAEEEARSSG